MSPTPSISLPPSRTVGTGGVFVAGVALVVSASTLVSDFTGFTTLGAGFAVSLVIGLCIVLPVALSAADLTVAHPRAGGIYQFARSVIRGRAGRVTGLFLGLCFFGTFLFGASGETLAGAHALRTLVGSGLPVEVFVLAIALPAVAANLCGLRSTTWITAGLLVTMLGIRWFFGIAGVLGWSETGTWSVAHLVPGDGMSWWGADGVLARGVAFGFWSFVGIEGACAMAEETRRPERSIPRGLVLGLLAILVSAIVMGLGAIGTLPLHAWQDMVRTPDGARIESPQLAVGEAMFGPAGRDLMAIASVAATWSTLLIAFAAVPRMLFAIARDGMLFGRLSPIFAHRHPRTGTPVMATLLVAALCLVVALTSGAVVDCLYAASYLWFFRYLIVHVLACANRLRDADGPGVLSPRGSIAVLAIGSVALGMAFHFGFAGEHLNYGSRALVVIGGAAVLTMASLAYRKTENQKASISTVRSRRWTASRRSRTRPSIWHGVSLSGTLE